MQQSPGLREFKGSKGGAFIPCSCGVYGAFRRSLWFRHGLSQFTALPLCMSMFPVALGPEYSCTQLYSAVLQGPSLDRLPGLFQEDETLVGFISLGWRISVLISCRKVHAVVFIYCLDVC